MTALRALALVAILSVGLALPSTSRAAEPLTPIELQAHLQAQPGLQLLDVRTPAEYAAGHVPGARLVPHDQLAAHIGELDPSRPVVVYCKTGRRAMLAEAVLEQHHFDVRQLQGSWEGWHAAGLPVETGAPTANDQGESP